MGTKETKTEVEKSNYKDNPMFVIHDVDDEGKRKPYPFQFGVTKAKKILKHIDELKQFVKENE